MASDATVSMAAMMSWSQTAPFENFGAAFCGSKAETWPLVTEKSHIPKPFTQGAKRYS
jgi:hypothetical protein